MLMPRTLTSMTLCAMLMFSSFALGSSKASLSLLNEATLTPMSHMPLVAPLFIEDGNFTSTLVLVNGSGTKTFADVVVRDLSGRLVASHRVDFAPYTQEQLRISDILKSVDSAVTSGSITVAQDSSLKGMSINAQLSLTYSKYREPNYIDEELAMPDEEGSTVLRGVADDNSGIPLIAVTSLSDVRQAVTMNCIGNPAEERSQALQLEAGETIIVEACSGVTERSTDFESVLLHARGRSSGGIQLQSDGMPGSFAAFGLTQHKRGERTFFSAVNFNDPKKTMSSATVFTGVPVGASMILPTGRYTPQLTLANFGSEDAHVSVTYSRMQDGNPQVRQLRTVKVRGRATAFIDMSDLAGDPSLANSFVVTSDTPAGTVLSKLTSRGDSDLAEVELIGKDLKDLQNGGGHPWSLENGTDSTLLLFNHSSQTEPFEVAISNGKVKWQKAYKLAPMQTKAISIHALVRDEIKDDKGNVLSKDTTSGDVSWWTTDPGKGTGRLLQSNRQVAMARSFSCGYYYVLCGASISIQNYFIGYTDTQTFGTASGNVCLAWSPTSCSGDSGYGSQSYNTTWTADGTVATISGSNTDPSVNLYGANLGSALESATVSSGSCFQGTQGTSQTKVVATMTIPTTSFTTSVANGSATINGSISLGAAPAGYSSVFTFQQSAPANPSGVNLANGAGANSQQCTAAGSGGTCSIAGFPVSSTPTNTVTGTVTYTITPSSSDANTTISPSSKTVTVSFQP